MLEKLTAMNGAQKREFVNKNINQNIENLFLLHSSLKKLGEIELSDNVLNKIVEIAIEEKRIWAIDKLITTLGKRNSSLLKKIIEAKKDLTEQRNEKKFFNTNIGNLKVVEREILDLNQFTLWCESLGDDIGIEELRLIYSGILIHGINKEIGKNIFKYFKNKKKNKNILMLLKKEFNLKEKISEKNKNKEKRKEDDDIEIIPILNKDNLLENGSKVNVTLLEESILKKYLNDILFSLICLKDYESIYKIEKIIEPSFKKNEKEFLSFNFYKITALIDQKKYIQVKGIISNEIFSLPLTNKELMPFIYLMGEVYFNLGNYEEALNFYMSLQKDEVFQVKAMLKINEIKKN